MRFFSFLIPYSCIVLPALSSPLFIHDFWNPLSCLKTMLSLWSPDLTLSFCLLLCRVIVDLYLIYATFMVRFNYNSVNRFSDSQLESQYDNLDAMDLTCGSTVIPK